LFLDADLVERLLNLSGAARPATIREPLHVIAS
jgi:hypothetical protein